MPAEYEFDVFISYSSRDKVWVRGELLTRIEQAGLKAFIDFRGCVSPLAEPFLYNVALHPHLRSKTLLSTRLCPRALEARGGGFLLGSREAELQQMQPADAHAQEARRLATCGGPPDYTYKVAYDEAGTLLKNLVLSS